MPTSAKPQGLEHLHPSKATIEKDEIEEVVGEFRQFLERSVDSDGKPQSTILKSSNIARKKGA
jgi:hypothetical protein